MERREGPNRTAQDARDRVNMARASCMVDPSFEYLKELHSQLKSWSASAEAKILRHMVDDENLRATHAEVIKDHSLVITTNVGVMVETPLIAVSLVSRLSLSEVPLSRRLKNAKAEDLANVEVICDGRGLRWESLDEDLSLQGILRDPLTRVVMT